VLQNAGNYRNSQVYVEGSDFLPPPAFEVQGLVEELLDWVRRNPEELRPVEVAAVFHYRFASIHPFDDGNGRVARLLMNLFLIKSGYPFTVVRNYDRRRYYDSLRKADGGDLKPFVDFVARCVEESIDLFLRAVKSTDESGRFLSLEEAAKLVPYSQEYLSLLARRGRLAAVKIGKNWHVTQEALNDYLAGVSPRRKKTKRKSRQ
jgi:excisionase family DNA binding protein